MPAGTSVVEGGEIPYVVTPLVWVSLTGQGTGNQASTPREPIRRTADGKPDLQGRYMPDAGGANYGLERHAEDFLTPGGRGIVVDPPDGELPLQPWAKAEQESRVRPERGYDDPTAHAGTRCYTEQTDGTECDWGMVLV
jgi:hypothetical protein